MANVFDVAIVKSGSRIVQQRDRQVGEDDDMKQIQAQRKSINPKWAKYKIKSTRPRVRLLVAKVTLAPKRCSPAAEVRLQGRRRPVAATSGSSPGLLGLNTFDMSVAKDGNTYQSNALKLPSTARC